MEGTLSVGPGPTSRQTIGFNHAPTQLIHKYFVLFIFIVNSHFSCFPFIFFVLYPKYSLSSAYKTWSSANCSVNIFVWFIWIPMVCIFFHSFNAFSTYMLSCVAEIQQSCVKPFVMKNPPDIFFSDFYLYLWISV